MAAATTMASNDGGGGLSGRACANDGRRETKELIVVFNDRHLIFNTQPNRSSASDILNFVGDKTGWSTRHLYIPNDRRQQRRSNGGFEYVVVRTKSKILGGKGGFGSLLKSQSRQAGARATTNFGACRDLQGRRLRHVNDAVAAVQMQEWKEKIAAGQATEEDRAKAMVLETDSQVPGWYLQLPAWADVSKKETRKWKQQFRTWKREQEMEKQWKEEEKKRKEARISHYVDTATQASETVRSNLQSALEEGLKKQKHSQQQKQEASKRAKQQPDPPTSFLTLSGDIVLASENDLWHVQSQSNFCTMGIVLQWDQIPASKEILYWEVKLITGGLSQIGWAEPDPQRFKPVSETGDGVGDDDASFAYDGSRNISLHQSESQPYGTSKWKAGDVVGCVYNCSIGEISFTLNGKNLGIAHKIQPEMKLFPAASCNPKEILELHLKQSECLYIPESAVAVGEFLATENIHFEQNEDEEIKAESKDVETPSKKTVASKESDAQNATSNESPIAASPPEKPKAEEARKETTPEPLNLEDFGSVSELEALGLDRLKAALVALGVKCGGTLQQRAERLYSLKGLKPEQFPPKLLAKKGKSKS